MTNDKTIECPNCIGQTVIFNARKKKDEKCIICDGEGLVSYEHHNSYLDNLNPEF